MAELLIVGAGTTGQATGHGFAAKGHSITFTDIDSGALEALRADGCTTARPGDVEWDGIDVVFVCVPTPAADEAPFSRVLDALDTIGAGLSRTSKHVTVAIRSTLVPGTTDEFLIPRLERAAGGAVGDALGFAVNPEFLRSATADRDFEQPWLIVIGSSDDRSSDVLAELYAPFGASIIHCTPSEAELIKIGSNCFNALKISYFNELHSVATALGADSRRINTAIALAAEGMWNPAYGTEGGAPFGGSCLPQDVTNMVRAARDNGWDHRLIGAALELNQRMADGDDRHRQPA
jgi:UDPglucose 6-dehydrogenase